MPFVTGPDLGPLVQNHQRRSGDAGAQWPPQQPCAMQFRLSQPRKRALPFASLVTISRGAAAKQ
ncbi:hypothetical protein MNEG_10083, partial [Monoraphidium neglectum]